jgi:hypothetical protein
VSLPRRHNLAVVQRRVEPADSLNFFPTPPWGGRAFVEHVALPLLGACPYAIIGEPACGEGHLAEPLRESFPNVRCADVFDYGRGYPVGDFLGQADWSDCDFIFTNPPFPQAAAFAEKAIAMARLGAAMLVRPNFLHGPRRYRAFLEKHPPTLIAYYVERLPMHKGRWEPQGKTSTEYLWVCWLRGETPRPPVWIPPGQRKRLTRPGDVARFARPAPLLEGAAA